MARKKILIVDDDKDLLRLLGKILKEKAMTPSLPMIAIQLLT